MWFQPANSHTGQRHMPAPKGRTDDRIRLRANMPELTACIRRGVHRRQSESYARVYNTEYDRLKGWDNTNLSVTLTRPKSDLSFQFYVKNVFNNAPITDFFTNSDDAGLSTNVFTLDPRIFGFNISKRF